MDDGDGLRDGSGDRREAGRRRKTVSGRLQKLEDDDNTPRNEAMRFPWSSPSAPSSPTAPTMPTSPAKEKHKRTFSGGILQKLNFLRRSSQDGESRPLSRGGKEPPLSPRSAKSRKSIDDDTPITSPVSPPKDSNGLPFALRPVKTRKRKGSLRKTALLGGKRIMSEGLQRKNSVSAKSPLSQLPPQMPVQQTSKGVQPPSIPTGAFGGESNGPLPPSEHDNMSAPSLKRQFSYEESLTPSTTSTIESDWEAPAIAAARLSLVTEHAQAQQLQASGTGSTAELASPLDLKSPTSQTSYTSTDDDDVLTFDRPAAHHPPTRQDLGISGTIPKPMSSAATSYFPTPSETSLAIPVDRRHTSKQRRSPLSHTVSQSSLYRPPSPPPHDYTETEYWGWVILFVTWLTFTVGMGSCLDIWSWAWDIPEKPYAPPELEDDPTLPIVGYYPALIVLTGVVAWCWITVAWVGMKYFRHAGIEV